MSNNVIKKELPEVNTYDHGNGVKTHEIYRGSNAALVVDANRHYTVYDKSDTTRYAGTDAKSAVKTVKDILEE